jgi:sugar lactone lactonase YvrE
MNDVEELRRYVRVRADAVPESEARHILDRATRTWQQRPGRWRRPQTVLALGLALATIASIGFVQIWAVQHHVAAPKVVPTVVPQHTFKAAEGIAVGADGSVYISDYSGQRVFRLQTNGRLAIFAGTGDFAEGGDGGPATKASLRAPTGIAVDRGGNLYVADFWGNRVRRIDSKGIIIAIAGSVPTGDNWTYSNPGPGGSFSGDGGPATAAGFSGPRGRAVDRTGALYVADSYNGRVRRISPDGTVTSLDAPSLPPPAWFPRYLAFDAAGNLYVADGAPSVAAGRLISEGVSGGCRIVRVSPAGVTTVVAGTGTCGFSGDGGPAAAAQLDNPNGVAFDSAGNLYVADSNNQRIRRIDRRGNISTVAGTGTPGFSGDGGPGINAKLYDPFGIGIAPGDKLYIAEGAGRRVRLLHLSSGIITTAAS